MKKFSFFKYFLMELKKKILKLNDYKMIFYVLDLLKLDDFIYLFIY